jgi:hypothetical protein
MRIVSHTFCLLSSEDPCELFFNTTASVKKVLAICITYHIKRAVSGLSVILQNSILVALLYKKPTFTSLAHGPSLRKREVCGVCLDIVIVNRYVDLRVN